MHSHFDSLGMKARNQTPDPLVARIVTCLLRSWPGSFPIDRCIQPVFKREVHKLPQKHCVSGINSSPGGNQISKSTQRKLPPEGVPQHRAKREGYADLVDVVPK